ncbi:zinc finger protein 140-like isoform X2 [Plodia interpunctella]|uniref:zinc finger protein 140-like isoform X2 n=1 Tax=Plodia interpunctella TaxID=58824 RepID=UPI002367B9BE|nr:zinc finger protein 140-like isoform X2 [Plodia interpunctella]
MSDSDAEYGKNRGSNLRIKFETMSDSDAEYDRATVILNNQDLDNSEEDTKTLIPSLINQGCIELSSDEEDVAHPMRVREKTPSCDDTATNIDERRNTLSESRNFSAIRTRKWMSSVSHNDITSEPPVLAHKDVETQTMFEKADAATYVDVRTADVGVNVDVEELLLNNSDCGENMNVGTDNIVESSKEASNIYFQCEVCSCFYQSFKLLQKHTMSKHNKTISADHKKVSYDKKCKFCNSVYAFATYNKHIKNKHTDVFNKKGNAKKNYLTGPYECVICKTKFLSYNDGKRHRKVHDNIEQKVILRKIPQRGNDTPTTSKAKVERKSSTPLYKKPIPKSVLFQCPKCQINFFNYRNGLRHRIVCEKVENTTGVVVNCGKCDRKFLSAHIRGHYQQHSMTTDFNIQVIVDGIEHKILYRCMKCKVCMEERRCRTHFQTSCNNIGVPCIICNNKIDRDYMLKHKEAHSRMGLTKADIILVDVLD